MAAIELLKSTINEYESALASIESEDTEVGDRKRFIQRLTQTHGWTEKGALAVVNMANEYGAFMLLNALALAVALGKEDGDLGF